MMGIPILWKSVELSASSAHTDEFVYEQRSDDHKPHGMTVSPVVADMFVATELNYNNSRGSDVTLLLKASIVLGKMSKNSAL